jgi:hypothetical protein
MSIVTLAQLYGVDFVALMNNFNHLILYSSIKVLYNKIMIT